MTLVQRTPDTFHLLYVTEKLRLPPPTNDGYHLLLRIRTLALRRLQALCWGQAIAQVQFKTQTELAALGCELERCRTREQDEELAKQLEQLTQADSAGLQAGLKDKNPLLQLTAIQTIHRRRLHLESDLIECLTHPQPLIRSAARQALVRLARGTDFGPAQDANTLDAQQAVRRWKTWLAQQEGLGTAVPPPPLGPAEAEAARWVVELAQATPDKEAPLLEQMRSAPEPQGTLALASAIRELKPVRQTKAREVLAQRLVNLGEDVVKKGLTDADVEVRRAALTAAAMTKAKQHLPEVLKLLEDAQPSVTQTARATLRRLTGRDFGPAPTATALERTIAIGQWYRWWVNQQKGD